MSPFAYAEDLCAATFGGVKALGFVHGLDRGSHAMHRCWGQLDRTAMLQAPT
ncbi:hydrogenase (plasmid) [Ralstonia solanacearum]|nr:hydrogenase [Ralstonia solanacearum]